MFTDDDSSVVILHAPSDIQEQLYKKLLDIPRQRGRQPSCDLMQAAGKTHAEGFVNGSTL